MFNKGDIIIGKKREFDEAYHPVIFIDGPDHAPLTVILTHSDNFPCNVKLSGTYGRDSSHFIAHLIEKMSGWGPYEKIGRLTDEDIIFIENHISGDSITWNQYQEYTKGGCPDHR